MECPVCKKEFNEYTGRRPKKFCSDDCKVRYFNALKKVTENNKPGSKKSIETERHTSHNIGQEHNNSQPMLPNEAEESYEIKAAKARILVLQDELKHPPKNPLIGLRKWILVREQELKQLQEKKYQ